MCAGKTTVGRALAKELGQVFYDLDWYIEERFHTRISQIFAEEGENKFRDKEQRMLHEVAEFENIVLACGGGTPCFFDNMDYMNQAGETFYLKASVNTIISHLKISKGERPLLKGMENEELSAFITQQLEQREPFYAKAKHTIDVDVLDSFEKISWVVKDIKQHITT